MQRILVRLAGVRGFPGRVDAQRWRESPLPSGERKPAEYVERPRILWSGKLAGAMRGAARALALAATVGTLAASPAAAGSLTRTSSFAYDASGLLTQEVVEPDTPALRLQTDYGFDVYGNKTSVTVSGSGIVTRTTSSIFDAKGQFATGDTNPLGQSETAT